MQQHRRGAAHLHETTLLSNGQYPARSCQFAQLRVQQQQGALPAAYATTTTTAAATAVVTAAVTEYSRFSCSACSDRGIGAILAMAVIAVPLSSETGCEARSVE